MSKSKELTVKTKLPVYNHFLICRSIKVILIGKTFMKMLKSSNKLKTYCLNFLESLTLSLRRFRAPFLLRIYDLALNPACNVNLPI